MGSLWKAAQNISLEAEIQNRKKRYEAQAKSKATEFGSLASLASSYGLGNLVSSIANEVTSVITTSIHNRILQEVAQIIKDEATRIGDVLFTPHDLVQIFDPSRSGQDNSMLNEVVFGDTPMTLAAHEIRQRFERMQDIPYDHRFLLVISDGEPTDGHPNKDFLILKEAGVIVASCFVTDNDITEPRTLISSPDMKWPNGTRLMWDIASELDTSQPFAHYLIEHGWKVPKGSRLFIQVNHSEVLNEFVCAVTVQSQGHAALFIPKGR